MSAKEKAILLGLATIIGGVGTGVLLGSAAILKALASDE